MCELPLTALLPVETAMLELVRQRYFPEIKSGGLTHGARISREAITSHGCFVEFSYSEHPTGAVREHSGTAMDLDRLCSDGHFCCFGIIARIRQTKVVQIEVFSLGCDYPTPMKRYELELP